MRKLLISALLIVLGTMGIGQTFHRIESIDLRGGYLGLASWCDYDSDGFLDVFVTGLDFGGDFQHAEIYRNNGDNTFSETNITNIPRAITGDMSWGDYNNDGLPDLLYAGSRGGDAVNYITRIYKNTGNSGFVEIYHTLPGLSSCEVEWVDVDNDGLSDIYYHGINTNDEFDLGIYRNMGNDVFEAVPINIERISGPRGNGTVNSAKWADFNNDGLKDVVIAMSTHDDFRFEFYQNLGNFEFRKVDIGLPKLNYVQMAVGDINQDGLMDIVFIGSTKIILTSQDMSARVYLMINKGDMTFDVSYITPYIGAFKNRLELGDLDNDGYSDLLVYGAGSSMNHLDLYRNNHDNTFSYKYHQMINKDSGGVAVGDVDNDGDLDILYYGRMNTHGAEVTYIYENLTETANEPPQPPAILRVFAIDNNLEFSWDPGTDDLCLSTGLYYNLSVGSESNPDSLMSGMSFSGKLKTVSKGNIQSGLNHLFTKFPEGHFKAKVQSIDHSYNASVFSDTLDFCLKHTSNLFSDTLSVCSGDSLNIGIEGDYAGYLWNTGSQSPFISVGTEGLYNLNLLHADGCISSETVYVKVNPLPKVYLGRDTTLTTNDTLILSIANPYTTYLWNDDTQSDSLVFIASDYGEGTHHIWLKAGNEFGCYATDTIVITVVSDPFGIDDPLYTPKGYIYPLPFTNEIVLVNNSIFPGQAEISVINCFGKVVFTQEVPEISKKQTIRLPDLPEGIYILNVYYESVGLRHSYKIIK